MSVHVEEVSYSEVVGVVLRLWMAILLVELLVVWLRVSQGREGMTALVVDKSAVGGEGMGDLSVSAGLVELVEDEEREDDRDRGDSHHS